MFLCSLAESNEYTEFDIDDILHDIDYEEEVNRKIQEQKDAVSNFTLYILCYLINYLSSAFDGCNL